MTLTRSGDSITANIIGYSNTRDMASAQFTFTAANGQSITDPSVTVPAAALFAAWFSTANSQTYGSNFMYNQTFNLSADQSTIGSVTVTPDQLGRSLDLRHGTVTATGAPSRSACL